ncbi:serine aminopeptidase domain-containing protein [Psychrosphaera algicola]|uniref:serine aminopeptidase domain-containing protein n=1 Tax=Psychrosphaera algicola TaxID=3023714 RepID=UPI00351CFF7A
MAYDIVNQGYHVFIIDHQGQGLSSRILRNSHKGYVQNFDDYIIDLNTFVEGVVQGITCKIYI